MELMASRARLAPPPPDVDAPAREARAPLVARSKSARRCRARLNLKASLHRVLEILAHHHGAVRGIVSVIHTEGDLRVEASDSIGDGPRASSATASAKGSPARSSRAASRSWCRASAASRR